MANRDNDAAGFGMKWKGRYQHEVDHPTYQPSLGILVGIKPRLHFMPFHHLYPLNDERPPASSGLWPRLHSTSRGGRRRRLCWRNWAGAGLCQRKGSITPRVKNSYREHPHGPAFHILIDGPWRTFYQWEVEAASTRANVNLTTMKNILTGL